MARIELQYLLNLKNNIVKTKQIKEAKEIITAFEPGVEFSKLFDCKTVVSTCFGPLHISLSFDNRRNSHALYMRFEDLNDYNRVVFTENICSAYDLFNRFSKKWNYHSRDATEVLAELEERLGNLKYFGEHSAHLIEKC